MKEREIKKLLKICREFRRGILDNRSSRSMCWAVAAPLATYLSLNGYDFQIENLDFVSRNPPINHVVIKMPNGWIIDPTADQFSSPLMQLPEIYIGPMPEQYVQWMNE